jgi:hypothetical protein
MSEKENPAAIDVELKADEPAKTPDIEVDVSGSSDDVADAVVQLRHQLESEKYARQMAEDRERQAQVHAFQSQNEVSNVNLHLVNTAIQTAQQNAEIYKQRIAQAMAAGDFDAATEMQEAAASNRYKLEQLALGKQQMEQAPRPQMPQQRPADPVEALATQLTPRSAAWVRAHPEYARDQRMFQQMAAAHNLAVNSGLEPDSDAYFARVERVLDISNRGTTTDGVDTPLSEASAPVQRRSSPAAAPVSRTPVGAPMTPGRMRLSAAEHEMALNMKMTPEDYAREKLRIQRDTKNKMH